MRLRASGVVPIHGLNYRDRPEDAAGWLDELGDPYTRIGADRNGRVGIDWGVYGVPETFVVGPDGHRSEEHTSELQSLMRNSYAGLRLKKTTCSHRNRILLKRCQKF